MVLAEYSSVDHIVLANAHQHIIHVNEFLCLLLGNRLEVFSEPSLSESPMSNRVIVFVSRFLVLGFPPVSGE